MACSRCTSGCSGACAPGCTGACSPGCKSCASAGTCYGGCRGCRGCTSCSGCSSCSSAGTCSGGCSGRCTSCTSCSSAGTCSSNCTSGCKNGCKNYCNTGCKSSSMAVTLTEQLTASNIQTIADLILFELSRRPSVKVPNNTKNLFTAGSTIDDSKITKLIQNLAAAGQTVSRKAVAGEKALAALGQEIIDKLLTANKETIKIS